MGRSWLIAGRTIDETEEMVKASFDNDLSNLMVFLAHVTELRTYSATLLHYKGRSAKLIPFENLGYLKDDVATLIQFPALLGMYWDDDETKEWTRLFAPSLQQDGDGRLSGEYNMRASFLEIRALRDAGVPLEYAKAMDRKEQRYPVAHVVETWTAGISPEFAWAM